MVININYRLWRGAVGKLGRWEIKELIFVGEQKKNWRWGCDEQDVGNDGV